MNRRLLRESTRARLLVAAILASTLVLGASVQPASAGSGPKVDFETTRPDPCGLVEVRVTGLTVSVTDLGLNIGSDTRLFAVVWDYARAETMPSTEAVVAAGLQANVKPKGTVSHTYPNPGTYVLELAIATDDDPCQTFDIDAAAPPTGLLHEVTVPPKPPGPCGRKNFWGEDAEGRQRWRQFAIDAHNAANAGYEWAKSLDLMGLLIDRIYPPGTEKNAEVGEIKTLLESAKNAQKTLEVSTRAELETALEQADPVLQREIELAADEANAAALEEQLGQKELKGDARIEAKRKKSKLEKDIKGKKKALKTLKADHASELKRLGSAIDAVEAVDAPTAEFTELIKKLVGSGEPVLRFAATLLEKLDAGQTIAQVPGAAGALFWAPVAAIATQRARPPRGCKDEPAKPY